MKRVRMTIVMVCVLAYPGSGQQGRVPVVPSPREVTYGRGYFEPQGKEMTVRLSGIGETTSGIIVDQLAEEIRKRYGMELSAGEQGNPDIRIGVASADEALAQDARKRGILPGPELGDEGYILQLGKKEVMIVASSEAGAFYGVQTLKQLFRGTPAMQEIPVMTIRDWPAIGFRCVMDDISRGPVPNSEYLRQQVRRYAELKINHMSFYIEHVVRTEKYPDFAPAGGGISIGEFSQLSEYAKAYQIELVGNFQSLGHFEKILSLPQYRHLGATERMIDPLDPASMEFLSGVYTEMAPAFSSPYFTPDCDEAWDLTRGALSGAAKELGAARIYADHVTRIDSVLAALGKRTIIWADIALQYPEILDLLPRRMIMGAWDYSPSGSFAGFIDPLKEAGFEFVIAPGILNSNRLIPDYRMSTINIRNFINEGYEKGTLGVCFTVWDDGGMHFFSHDWYGVAYDAEQSWRPSRDSIEDFDQRFSRGIYGDGKNLVPSALHALNRLTGLAPTYEMNSGVFYRDLVPERGGRVTFDPESWTEVKRWTAEARRILTAGFLPQYDLDLAYIKFTLSQYEFMAWVREKLLEAAGAYDRACMLQLSDRGEALEQLRSARDIIGGIRLKLERLKDEFLILWDIESRPYWRDRASLQFDRHLDALDDQLKLVEGAAGILEGGGSLPPPAEVRLDIRRRQGQFFQYWLLAGSFTIDSFDEVAPDFLAAMGGEAAARPYPGMNFTDPGGRERTWSRVDSPRLGEVDLASVFVPATTAVAYAYCTLEAPAKREVTALLGSNDGATVWCNGQQVYHIHTKRSLIPDEDRFILPLEEGTNHILVKVEQWKGGWGFSFRLKDVEVRNHKQRYFIQ